MLLYYQKHLLFYLITSLFSITNISAQTKHALIFAIGNYPKAGGWPQLSSIRDVSYIKQALIKQGFSSPKIKSVTDANATVEGIYSGLKTLIEEVSPGDIVLIHFSCHGEQLEDDNGDEMDGYDESIVTYNAILPSRSKNFKKDQSQYFRDDELGRYIGTLRQKLGRTGDVIVFMDLCNSGSGTRGLGRARGGQPPFVSSTFNSKKFADYDTLSFYGESNRANADPAAWASYVVYSAVKDEELNYEIVDENNLGMGSLTYSICKSLENLNPGTSYRSLFSKIRSIINIKLPNQHPVIEGNGIDRLLFGGSFIEQKPYAEMLSQEGRNITLNAGKFAGLDVGAKIAMYKSGTIDPALTSPVSVGTIIKAENYKAIAEIKTLPRIVNTAAYWFFVTEPVYKMPPVNIHLTSMAENESGGFSETEISKTKEAFKGMRTVQFDCDPQLIICKGPLVDSIKIAVNGYLYKILKINTDNLEDLKKTIQDYAQYRFLQALEITNPAISVQVKLIPYVNGKADSSALTGKVINGNYEFTDSDTVVIWARNTGSLPVFLNILDLQPDGSIGPIFPNKNHSIYSKDLKIERQQARLFAQFPFSIEKPYGTEIFKVFASSKEIDMESIISTKSNIRGNTSILERLVKTSSDAAERGTENHYAGNADGSTFNILFRIRPADQRD